MKARLFKYIEKSPPKIENFQIKNCDIFQISAQRRGGSNGYPQSMFCCEAVLTSIHNLCFEQHRLWILV